MSEEILKSQKASQEALNAISKIISQFEWPSEKNKIKWTKIYESLIQKNKYDTEVILSNSEYKRLHKILEKYFLTKDFSVLNRFSNDLKLICSVLDTDSFYNKNELPLIDKKNEQKFDFLLNDISKHSKILQDVAIPLLELNLRQKNGINILRKYLKIIFSKLENYRQKDFQEIYNHLELYIDKSVLIANLINEPSDDFKTSLKNIGILRRFCVNSNLFLMSTFFDWIISRKISNLEIINKNFEQIKQCTADKEKIIQAIFITKIYKKKYQKSYEEIQKLIDLMNMKNADSDFYWQVNNLELQEKYKVYLNNAYKIVSIMITTDFISYIFNYFGDKSELDNRRIIFWRNYAGKIIDFKIFYSLQEKRILKNRIVLKSGTSKAEMYGKIVEEHSVIDNDYRGNVALIFKFEKLIVVEFPKSGTPAQIYQPNNKISKLFNSNMTYANFDDIKQYKDVFGEHFVENQSDILKYRSSFSDNYFENKKREGSFPHRGMWEVYLGQYLKDFNIYTDKEKGGR